VVLLQFAHFAAESLEFQPLGDRERNVARRVKRLLASTLISHPLAERVLFDGELIRDGSHASTSVDHAVRRFGSEL